ncbi:MAG TPA: AMP-binding protein [Solirubrobacteraceae bacterium]|nr:AMP-binding protein [Solirubrobacteraceae bacterium]
MWIEGTTVGHLLDRAAERSPDHDAVVFPDTRRTYGELSEATDAIARSFAGLGIRRGDKVGILMPNRLEFVLAFIGAAKLGAIPVPINARFKAYELGHVISHADVRLLLTCAGPAGTADYPAILQEVFPALTEQADPWRLELAAAPELRQIVDIDADRPGFLARGDLEGAGAQIGFGEVEAMQSRVRIRDIAMLMYTSGTSARPKGCLLTHEALVRHGGNVARSRFLLTAEDSFWDPLPLFHIGGIVPMLGCFSVGARYCHAGHFDPRVALRMLEAERCTVLYPAFETIWLAVLDHPEFESTDLSAVRLIQSIAVPERLAQLEARMPWAAQVSSYGATESSSNLTLTRPDDPYEVRIGTLGRVLPGMEVRVLDAETGDACRPGEIGELCYRGYSLFEGYYKDPELTSESFDADGFFHSQDLGKLDEDGQLVYVGRLKDMLKVGGENVSALEVEGYLVTHPAVNIAQVVAAPDARYGEVPAAFLELKQDGSIDEQGVIDFCLDRIATYKVPRYVRFVRQGEWPMSGTKIQKFVLRERISSELREREITEAPRLREPAVDR